MKNKKEIDLIKNIKQYKEIVLSDERHYDPATCRNGGGYATGVNLYPQEEGFYVRPWTTGEYCPRCGQWSCNCTEEDICYTITDDEAKGLINSYKRENHTIEALSVENDENKWYKFWNGEPNSTEKTLHLLESFYMSGFDLKEVEQNKKVIEAIYSSNFELHMAGVNRDENVCFAVLSKTTELGYHFEEKLTFAPTMDSLINSIENLFQNFDANKEADKVWQSINTSDHATHRSILNDMNGLQLEINEMWFEMSKSFVAAEKQNNEEKGEIENEMDELR